MLHLDSIEYIERWICEVSVLCSFHLLCVLISTETVSIAPLDKSQTRTRLSSWPLAIIFRCNSLTDKVNVVFFFYKHSKFFARNGITSCLSSNVKTGVIGSNISKSYISIPHSIPPIATRFLLSLPTYFSLFQKRTCFQVEHLGRHNKEDSLPKECHDELIDCLLGDHLPLHKAKPDYMSFPRLLDDHLQRAQRIFRFCC